MARNAPGKEYHKGLTLLDIPDIFRDEDAARHWIAEARWRAGRRSGSEHVQCWIKHKTMTDCRRACPNQRLSSVNNSTEMESSNLPCRIWVGALNLFVADIKGVSSTRQHREKGISRQAAWFMLHRLQNWFDALGGGASYKVEVGLLGHRRCYGSS